MQKPSSLKIKTLKIIPSLMEDKENSQRMQEMYSSLSAKRFDDESFEEYKVRMKLTNKAIKNYLRKRK